MFPTLPHDEVIFGLVAQHGHKTWIKSGTLVRSAPPDEDGRVLPALLASNRASRTEVIGQIIATDGADAVEISARPPSPGLIRVHINGRIDAEGLGSAINAAFNTGYVSVNNRGTITSEAITIAALGGTMEVRNSGTILGGKAGSAITFQGTDGLIHNSGVIVYVNVGIVLLEADARIINTGSTRVAFNTPVEPGPAITDLGGGNTVLVNRGLIDGNVVLRSPSEVVNSGDIYGDVLMSGDYHGQGGRIQGSLVGSATDDRFDLRGSEVTGVVLGNGGSDVYDLRGALISQYVIGGSGNDRYIVGANAPIIEDDGGVDIVWAYSDYVLGADLEWLRLMGTEDLIGVGTNGANRIWGNGGDNIIAGGGGQDVLHGGAGNDAIGDGAGNDMMYGGAGADLFVMAVDNARDWIRDFEAGVDQIDIIDWEAEVPDDLGYRQRGPAALEITSGRESLVLIAADRGPIGFEDVVDSLIFG